MFWVTPLWTTGPHSVLCSWTVVSRRSLLSGVVYSVQKSYCTNSAVISCSPGSCSCSDFVVLCSGSAFPCYCSAALCSSFPCSCSCSVSLGSGCALLSVSMTICLGCGPFVTMTARRTGRWNCSPGLGTDGGPGRPWRTLVWDSGTHGGNCSAFL